MKNLDPILQLRKALPETAWPLVLSALKNDTVVWTSLQDTSLNEAAFNNNERTALEDWSPAALALLAIEPTISLKTLSSVPLAPLETSLRQNSLRTYEALNGRNPAILFKRPLTLVQSGLAALALRERRRLTGSWNGLSAELSVLPYSMWLTPLACLYGLIPDPADMLASLFQGEGVASPECRGYTNVTATTLALHAVLSNPQSDDEITVVFSKMLLKLPLCARQNLLDRLSSLRPRLAVPLAARSNPDQGQKIETAIDGTISEDLFELERLTHIGWNQNIGWQSVQAAETIDSALQLSRWIQAKLFAQLAQAKAREGDKQCSIDAWYQAVNLDDDNPTYQSKLVMALQDAGRGAEAQQRLSPVYESLSGDQGEIKGYHPELLATAAQLAIQAGDTEKARELALLSMASIRQAPPSEDDPNVTGGTGQAYGDTAILLAKILSDLDLPAEAAQAAQFGLTYLPLDTYLLTLLGLNQLASHKPGQAVQAFQLAVALEPDNLDHRRKLAECLEACKEWSQALEEREMILERSDYQTDSDHTGWSADLLPLGRCALQGGQPNRAIEAAQSALEIKPEDALALTLLGEAYNELGDLESALDYLDKAAQCAPDLASTWLALARVQSQSGDAGQVIDTLRAAIQAAPASSELYYALGEAYSKGGSLTQALEAFQQSDNLDRDNLLTVISLGKTYYQLGHHVEARQVLEKAFHEDPIYPELADIYAKTLLALGDTRTALPALAVVLEFNPDDPAIHLEYARSLLEIGVQPEKAIQTLQHILELLSTGEGESASQEHGLRIRQETQALLAEAFEAAGDPAAALPVYQKALDSDLAEEPTWMARLSFGFGRASLALGQAETAIAALHEAALADPQNPSIQRTLSDAYRAASLYEDALQSARAALSLSLDDLDSLAWFTDQILTLSKEDPFSSSITKAQVTSEALNTLSRAIQLAPDRTDLLLRLGNIQATSGDTATAIETFRQILTSEQANIMDLHDSALALLKLGDPAGAVSFLERASQLCQDDPEACQSSGRRIAIMTDLARAYHASRDLQSALEGIEMAVQFQPDNPQLQEFKAELLLELGQPQAALKCLEEALKKAPTQPNLLLRTATVLRVTGDLPGALEYVETLLKTYDRSSQDSNRFQALTLAANLACSLLQPERARQVLSRHANASFMIDDPSYQDSQLLRAELALETGEEALAAEAVETVQETIPEHPRLKAIQARLEARRGDISKALEILESALQSLGYQKEAGNDLIEGLKLAGSSIDQQPSLPTGPQDSAEIPASSTPDIQEDFLAANRATATMLSITEAALELGLWDTALFFVQRAVDITPLEPLPHLNQGRSFILRAETQRLNQALEVSHLPPGQSALGLPAQQAAEQALATARQRLDRYQPPSSEDSDEPQHSLIDRWEARCKAVFQPSLKTAEALGNLANPPATPDEVAAQIAALRHAARTKPEPCTYLEAALQSARAYPQHQLVMAQLALLLDETEARDVCDTDMPVGEIYASSHIAINGLWGLVKGRRIDQRIMPVAVCLSRLAYRFGDYPTALECIQVALDMWPEEPRWQALAAELSLASGNTTEAIQRWQQALRLEPDHLPHHLALGQALLARASIDPTLLSQAIEILANASQLAPDQPEPWITLARAYNAAGDFSKAAESADIAIGLSGEQTEPLLLRAEIALLSGDAQEALDRARAALKLEKRDSNDSIDWATNDRIPSALFLPITLLMVRAMCDLDQPAEALFTLEEALPYVENPLPLHLERVDMIRRSQGNQAALKALSDLAKEFPDEPTILAPLATALSESGQDEAAIRAAQSALQAGVGKIPPLEQAQMQFLLGRLLRQAGQLDQSIHHLSETIRQVPNLVDAYLELGKAHEERRQHVQALQVYQKATTLNPVDPRPYYQAGLALKEGKDYLAAESMLRRAAELAPNDLAIHRQLGAMIALNLVHNRRRTGMEA